uniref:Uncharacterized protein n=1 Tax=Arundo donax TaxID=35708 RepID=A0A0A9DIR8_ARUDO
MYFKSSAMLHTTHFLLLVS